MTVSNSLLEAMRSLDPSLLVEIRSGETVLHQVRDKLFDEPVDPIKPTHGWFITPQHGPADAPQSAVIWHTALMQNIAFEVGKEYVLRIVLECKDNELQPLVASVEIYNKRDTLAGFVVID